MEDLHVPVTSLTGFLGVGKTTLLNAILSDGTAGRVDFIVNEFCGVGLDHDLSQRSDQDINSLCRGCLCCSVSGDLSNTVTRLFDRKLAGKIAFDFPILLKDWPEEDRQTRVVLIAHNLSRPEPQRSFDMLHLHTKTDAQSLKKLSTLVIDNRLPVIALSCFHGAGKTTLPNLVSKNRDGLCLVVIVNDMSEVNIYADDADAVRAGTEPSRTDEALVEMLNGCICCTLRDDLMDEVHHFAAESRFYNLLIESTRISESLPVAAIFDFSDEVIDGLLDVARSNTTVMFVETVSLLKDFSSHDFLVDRGEVKGEKGRRTSVDLLNDQKDFVDILISYKVTDATLRLVQTAREIVRTLGADAEIIETKNSQVAAKNVLDNGLFDFDKAHEHSIWTRDISFAEHVFETEEYGITSYVHQVQRLFVRKKILAALKVKMPGVTHPKGYFWIVTRPEKGVKFSLVGSISSLQPIGTLWASLP